MRTKPDICHAALMAEKTLIRFGVRSLPVDPADMLRQIPGTRLMSMAEASRITGISDDRIFGENTLLSAALIAGEGKRLVLYRQDQGEGELRFSLAHELGHIALRHQDENTESWQEQEADLFALFLLIPSPLIRFLRERKDPVFAEQLAALCFVPRAKAVRRLSLGWEVSAAGQLDEMMQTWLERMHIPGMQGDRLHRITWREAE